MCAFSLRSSSTDLRISTKAILSSSYQMIKMATDTIVILPISGVDNALKNSLKSSHVNVHENAGEETLWTHTHGSLLCF
jgi:hypothetical protein